MKEKITVPLAGLKGCFVAGGAITSLYTNKPINDYDIYPKSLEARRDAIRWAYESGYWNCHYSDRALTFARGEEAKVQIMLTGVYETAEQIFDHFDFTVCMGAFDLDIEEFILHKNFLIHCSQRFLSFNQNTLFPYASIRRLEKYQERGYTIGVAEKFKMLLACQNKPIQSWDELKHQFGGVYGEAMVIPEGVDFSFEAAIEAIGNIVPTTVRSSYATAEEAIACTSDTSIKLFRHTDKYNYTRLYGDIYDDGSWELLSKEPPKFVEAGVADLYPGLKFYKKVAVINGELCSLYRPSFKYPFGVDITSPDPFIYSHSTIEAARNHSVPFNLRDSETKILTLQVDDISDVVVNQINMPQLKKCRVIEISS